MNVCPICKKTSDNTSDNASDKTSLPFCSKRCADIDLGRWLKGVYSIPGSDGEAVIAANDLDADL